MFNQPFDVEKITLVTKKLDVEREITQIALIKTAQEGKNKQSILQHALESMGWLFVKFGNHLISRYGLCEMNLSTQPKPRTT